MLADEEEIREELEELAKSKKSPASFNRTDTGNAQRLVDDHGHEVRYCYQTGKWLIWNGSCWDADADGGIYRKAKETIRNIYLEAGQIEDEPQRKAMASHALRSEAKSRLEAMISLAQSEAGIPVSINDFDKDPFLLNVNNGTIDLRTGDLLPHDAKKLLSKLTPVRFDQDATCPKWDSFLKQIMSENDDLIRYIQRAVGYALTGDQREQVLFILYGSGANGKSTFLSILLFILGEYGQQTDFSTFSVKSNDSVRNDLARLKGARLVSTSEIE